MRPSFLKIYILLYIFIFSISVFAQDERAQIPSVLQKTYFEVNIGSIDYDFTQFQPEAGFSFQSLKVPHPAVRLVLFGYEFNKYLSAQLTYMRPVTWVKYKYKTDATGAIGQRTIWMNVGGLTLKPQLPISNRFSVYGEAGLGIITRSGFNDAVTGMPVITNANYATFLFGGGLKYNVSKSMSLQLSTAYSPAKASEKQPSTSFVAAGFSYRLQKVSEKKIAEADKVGYIHPKHMLQIGYSSNVLGYGVNNFVSSDKFPIFWGGEAEVYQGVSLTYQRNIFHTARVFSLDWGVSTSYWQSKGIGTGLSNPNKQDFFTLSVFPVARFTVLHTKPLDAYFYYSVAGPTYISKIMIDGENTGKHFTFQDNMGAGIYFGEKRNLNAEIMIGHYSNGNLFPHNDAVKVPLTLKVGYNLN
jgi:opacity protein-like surface antigen